MAADLIRMLPDAMLYSYAPGQPQPAGYTGAALVVLDYLPNPAFVPPTRAAEALTGLKGRLWIDAISRRVVRAEANVFQ